MTTQTLVQGGEAGQWEQAIYAFLAEKERRSGSMRTVRAYSAMSGSTASSIFWANRRTK